MSETKCPTCGSDGVVACVGLDGADHPDRPPFFDEQTLVVLSMMSQNAKNRPA